MTEREIEDVWQAQSAIVTDADTRRWMRRMQLDRLLTPGLVVLACVAGVAFMLRASLLFTDPGHTLGNSSLDLVLAAVPLLAVVIQLRGRVRLRRDVRALQHDMRAWVDYLIEHLRREIRDSHRFGPLAIVAVLAGVGLAKWQAVASGRETFENALGGWAVAFMFCIVGAAAAYHVTVAFQQPRLEALEKVRREFDT